MAGYNDPKTQDSIVRQSSLKLVVDYSKTIGKPFTLKEVIGITNVIVDYCQEGYSKELAKRLTDIDNHVATIKTVCEE